MTVENQYGDKYIIIGYLFITITIYLDTVLPNSIEKFRGMKAAIKRNKISNGTHHLFNKKYRLFYLTEFELPVIILRKLK